MLIDQLNWPEIEEKIDGESVVLIPTGSTEQHGPHCPLGTDSLIASQIAQEGARRSEVLCTPVIPVSVSSHHRNFPGTLWVSPDTFRSYVKEVALGLKFHGVRKIIFVNGHGGNSNSLEEVSTSLGQDEDICAVPWTWFAGVKKFIEELFDGEDMNHADGPETSVMLYLEEDLVRRDRLKKAEKDGSSGWGISVAGTRIPVETDKFSKSGATGLPTTASKRKGKLIFERSVEKLTELIAWLKDEDL